MKKKKTFEPRKCEFCGEMYIPVRTLQKFCFKCRKTRLNAYRKEWMKSWRNRMKKEDPERYRALLDSYKPKTEAQKLHRIEYDKKRNITHRAQKTTWMLAWRKRNPERDKETRIRFNESDKGKEHRRRGNETRQRRMHEDPEYRNKIYLQHNRRERRKKLLSKRNIRNRLSHVVSVYESQFRSELQSHSSMLASAGIVSI